MCIFPQAALKHNEVYDEFICTLASCVLLALMKKCINEARKVQVCSEKISKTLEKHKNSSEICVFTINDWVSQGIVRL